MCIYYRLVAERITFGCGLEPNHMELATTQEQTLTALANSYQSKGAAVTGTEIADRVGRHPGTVRNQMQSLRALGLVEGITGPNGGYEPTNAAYEALGRRAVEDAETMTVAHGHERIDATVDRIQFTNVHHPEKCNAVLTFREPVERFSSGDPVAVGPTPCANLVVVGEVSAIDAATNQLHLRLGRIESPVERE